NSLAVLVGCDRLALDLLEHDGRRARRRELQHQRAFGLELALGVVRLVPDLARHRHLHLEHPRRALRLELGHPGVAERDVAAFLAGDEVVHLGVAGGLRGALLGEPDPLEGLAVEAVAGLERLGVPDAHGPVLVPDGEREREVVSERGGRGDGEREAREGGVPDGDLGVADEAVGGEGDGQEDGLGEDGEAGGAAEDGLARVVGDAGAAAVAECVVAAALAAAHGSLSLVS
uniref:Uncharacterized protein n=1 Tax=Triticum urartu TaxID=4572 RepID=A0A8R7PPM7_TRIUA